MLVALFLLTAGLLTAMFPYIAWYLSIGWKFDQAEPSDLALIMHRITGIIAFIIGFVLIVSSCSNFINQSTWEGKFKDKLTPENVASMTVGLERKPLSEDEINEVISFIRNSKFYFGKDNRNYFSSSFYLRITFKDGSSESIDRIIGREYEIRPSAVSGTTYFFTSIELDNWVAQYHWR